MRVLGLVAIIATCGFTAVVVRASRIHYQPVDLATAVQSAPFVVRAKYLGGSHPAIFNARRALKGSRPVRGRIKVFTASAAAWGRVRQAYDQTGVRRSPLINKLEHASALRRRRAYCLLLEEGLRDDEYVLAVVEGHVSAPCPEVVRLIEHEMTVTPVGE